MTQAVYESVPAANGEPLDATSLRQFDAAPSRSVLDGGLPDVGPLRLNLGSGPNPLPGYWNLDGANGDTLYPEIRCGAILPDEYSLTTIQPVPGTCDEVRASHVLEHFPHRQVLDVLKCWVSYLKPGGVLKVAVPDFAYIAKHYLDGRPINTQGYVMGGQTDDRDFHKAVFDRDLLTELFHQAGLGDVRPWASDARDCAALPVSLNLQGTRPAPVPKLKVAAAMSVPRLGFQDNFFCWAKALLPLGIFPTKYDGAFWGQCLERVMSGLAEECEYVLAVDYDTVFTREAVENLLRLAAAHPEADALAPVQCRRQGEAPLLTLVDERGNFVREATLAAFQPDVTRVATAHFGLTLLKAEKLRALPHPWFLGVPAADGTWGEGRQDDDVYFWRQWAKAGHTVYLANRVAVGHAQVMVTWPGRDFSPVHQYPSEFWDGGMPQGVWQ
jgi:hypothetical protein